jgi:transcription antitermination factor NusG
MDYTFENKQAIRPAALCARRACAVVAGSDAATENWFVVRTQPHRERWAAENVARSGALYYLPEILETVRIVVRGVRKREFRRRPLFPCYLFVKTEGQWHFLLTAFGVAGIVTGSNGSPGTIPGRIITTLREREKDGIVQLPYRARFKAGDPVRITKGSCSGYVGVYQGTSATDRVRVLLDFLGRKTSTIVAESVLEAA